jgi:hypothetical protein
MLCVFVHGPALNAAATEALEGIGAPVTWAAGQLQSVPESVEYGLEYRNVAAVFPLLQHALREHLLRSLAAGPPPSRHLHDADLRSYLIDNAT